MAEPRKYGTATAFRRALEDRLKQTAVKERLTLERTRREAAFDRLLARLFATADPPWVLKGGHALELRLKEARATRDIDLALRRTLGQSKGPALNAEIRAALQEAMRLDLGDFFRFELGEIMQDLDAAPYGGARFPVAAILDERVFVQFHLDVGAGDVVLSPVETTMGRDWLGFAGFEAPKFPTISREQHFAEKVHAYTLPRLSTNSRVRDMVDMALLIKSRPPMDLALLRIAIDATFARRKTHAFPKSLQLPPGDWRASYAKLARPCGLSEDLDEAFRLLDGYLKSAGA